MVAASLLSHVERLERSIVHWITCDWHHETLGRVFHIVQSEWIGVPLFLLALSLIARRSAPRAFRAMVAGLASFGLCMGLATLMWSSIDRERPPHHFERWLQTAPELATCATQPEAFAVRGHVSSRPSFPSRHALTIGSFAGVLFLASRVLGVWAWCYGLFVIFGRIYVGKHWPTDLIGGVAIGWVVVWLCWRAVPVVLGRIGLREWNESPMESAPECSAG